MSRKLLVASLLPLLFLTHARGQGSPKPEAILAHRGVEEHLRWYLNGELLLDHVDLVRRPETKVAIRVCTKLSPEEALRKSRGAPDGIANFLKEAHSYSPARILILFSEACPPGEGKRISIPQAPPTDADRASDVEVWVVPQGAMPPPSDKAFTAHEWEDYLMSEDKKREKGKRRSKAQPRRSNKR